MHLNNMILMKNYSKINKYKRNITPPEILIPLEYQIKIIVNLP